jgi:peptide/nickel transport system ATP-binding protein
VSLTIPSNALFEIKNLSIWFGSRPAVSGLTLSVPAGEVLGLVGESGSGKSVTALAALRLLDPAARVEGEIFFAGKNLLTLPAEEMRRVRGSQIAMIFQEPMTALNPVMTVGNQIAEAALAHHPGHSRKQVRKDVLEALDAVSMPEPARRYNDYPHQFSGGQRQRILIAMALVNRPRLLIADEPTTALDVTVQAQILDLLAQLRRQFGLSMLFISHDLAVVAQVSDRVAVMRHGVLLEQGAKQQIFRTPLHGYTRSLLGAAPTLHTDRTKPLTTLSAADLAGGELVEAETGHWVRR